jgi:Chaperone of endosialidase
MKTKTMTTPHVKSIGRSPLRVGLFLIPLVLACFALLPSVQAAPDPAPPPGANTADGAGALANVTTGDFNTAFGTNALNSLTTGDNNGAQGNSALFSNTVGSGNVAVGSIALRFNIDGDHNVAVGNTALNSNVHGNRNTAIGYGTLRNTTVNDNTAVGWSAAISNTTGIDNVAVGREALVDNTTGDDNTAVGSQALFSNTGGESNTGIGPGTLAFNTTGNSNTVIGASAGFLITGSRNVNIGAGVTTGAGVSNETRIRNVYASVATARAVYVNSSNKIGTLASTRRVKDEIKRMGKASEAIHALKPVTFRYTKEVDPARALSFRLIAEEVAEISADLITRDEQGNPQTVR